MEIGKLSNTYMVKRLVDDDCGCILDLYNSNPQYFKYCPPLPTIDSIKKDLSVLPNNVDSTNKYYLGFYDDYQLIGVMDLITNYPDEQTCYIGLFMIDGKYQNRGIGSKIINEVCNGIKNNGYRYIELAYIVNNETAKRFWLKNEFKILKQTKDSLGQLDVVRCLRKID